MSTQIFKYANTRAQQRNSIRYLYYIQNQFFFIALHSPSKNMVNSHVWAIFLNVDSVSFGFQWALLCMNCIFARKNQWIVKSIYITPYFIWVGAHVTQALFCFMQIIDSIAYVPFLHLSVLHLMLINYNLLLNDFYILYLMTWL